MNRDLDYLESREIRAERKTRRERDLEKVASTWMERTKIDRRGGTRVCKRDRSFDNGLVRSDDFPSSGSSVLPRRLIRGEREWLDGKKCRVEQSRVTDRSYDFCSFCSLDGSEDSQFPVYQCLVSRCCCQTLDSQRNGAARTEIFPCTWSNNERARLARILPL